MSQSLQALLNEHDELTRQLESATFMLDRINETLAEDQRTLETHHAARCEIAATKAVLEARLTDIDFELQRQAEEAEDEHLV